MAVNRSLVNQARRFSKTHQITSGDLQPPRHPTADFLEITERSLQEVCAHARYGCSEHVEFILTIYTVPAKLDPSLMKEPRVIQGVPRINNAKARRKPIPSMLGPNGRLNEFAQSPPE